MIEKEMMRQQRREARETRRKEQELFKLKTEIKQFLVDKGEIREHILQSDLLDINGHFERGKHFFGAIGG
jgi:hypothetical protein